MPLAQDIKPSPDLGFCEHGVSKPGFLLEAVGLVVAVHPFRYGAHPFYGRHQCLALLWSDSPLDTDQALAHSYAALTVKPSALPLAFQKVG